jgi:phage/plasmid-like protein (TIGR03299 family)
VSVQYARIKILRRKKEKMAHNLEEQNGEVAFALRGTPAWHNLANKVFAQDENVTTATMLEQAKLSNWNVSLEDIGNFIPETYRNSSDNFLVTRTNPFDNGTDVLSIVGGRYKVVQNEDLFSFADNILDGGAKWESAGSLKKGKVVFGSLTIDKEITLDPNGSNDKTKMYLIVWTSHDGSVAVQSAITPVRVVCQNTLNLAMRNAKQSFKIRHTQTVDGKIAAAREALGLTMAYADEFEKEAKALFDIKVDNAKFSKIINTIYPKPDKDAKGSLKKWENKVVLIDDLYHNSPTNTNIKGTAWGVVNALTERLDYFRTARKGSNESLMAGASGFDPVITAEKNKIVKQVFALAK